MGFAFTETLTLAGTDIFIQYRHHLEACYCIEGEGEIEGTQGRKYEMPVGLQYPWLRIIDAISTPISETPASRFPNEILEQTSILLR